MTRYAIVKFIDGEQDNTPTWPEWVREYETRRFPQMRPATLRCLYKPTIKLFSSFIKDKRIGEIKQADAFAFMKWMRESLKFAEGTIRTRTMTVAAILQEAVRRDPQYITRNPFHDLQLPKAPPSGRVLTDSEIKLLLSALWDAPKRAAILSLYTGMRRGEICSLEWSQINHDAKGSWVFIPANKAKSGRARTIMLHKKALEALGKPKDPSESVFNLSETMLNTAVTHAWRLTGLGRVRFHDLRHTWYSRAMENTEDMFAIFDASGAKDWRSAMPYNHMSRARRERAVSVTYDIWGKAGRA